MTPTEQTELRVKLAEWAGEWTFTPESNYVVIAFQGRVKNRYFPSEPERIELRLDLAGVPPYPASLDAVAELEARLTGIQMQRYLVELRKFATHQPVFSEGMTATALQRCLAMAKTLNIELTKV